MDVIILLAIGAALTTAAIAATKIVPYLILCKGPSYRLGLMTQKVCVIERTQGQVSLHIFAHRHRAIKLLHDVKCLNTDVYMQR